MQLTRLEVKGFKSFGDKITINFNEGITAIAGPNGCGKSNVVDAIRWVLGEQSTKMLRSEKMENIIFNGTKNRKPSQLAEVSLTFDNTRNILPTEFAHVTITRKLYRNGDSEYRLNDVQCRLKDINDLFLDTGIGSDSYSIIELRMIDEIIANKEGSRRGLFEEASGISKYKLRKKQTFNKLRDTEADLSRVNDLLFEIEKNMKTLENQAKKADRYYKLKDQYKNLSVSLASFHITGFRDSLSRIASQEEQQLGEKTSISTKLDTLETSLHELKTENLTREKNLSAQQKASNEFVSRIRTFENEKKIKNEQLRHLRDKEQRLSDEILKDKNQLDSVSYQLKRLAEEHLLEQENLSSIESGLSNRKLELDELRLQQQTSKQKLDQFAKQNNEVQNQVHTTEKDLTILKIQRDALYEESRRHLEDTQSKEAELNQFNIAIEALDQQLNSRTNEFAELEEFEKNLADQIRFSEDIIHQSREQQASESRKLDALRNEYNLTKSLVDNLEGFPESIRFLKKNTTWAKKAPLLSDVLFCKEEYRVAIENYLETVMNHYVVESQTEAVHAIQLLSSASRGRANFFILEALETLPEPGKVAMVPDNVIPALSIIETDPKYYRLCHQLLRNVYLVTSMDEAEMAEALPDQNVVYLSSSGKYSKSRLTMSGGSVGLFDGKRIGRARNLDKLSKDIQELDAQIQTLKDTLLKETQRLETLRGSSKRNEVRILEQDINRLNNERITLHTRRDQYLSFIENSQNRKQDIELKMQSINDELSIAEPALAKLKETRHEMGMELMEKQQDYQELTELVNEKANDFNQDNIRFHQQQNKVSGLQKDLEHRENQQESLENNMAANGQELSKCKAAMDEVLQHVDLSDEDLAKMYAQKEEFEKGVSESEKLYFTSRSLITETENSIATLRKNKEHAELMASELSAKKNDLRMGLTSLKERLAVEFSIDIEDLLDAEVPQGESEDSLREKTLKIKKQLDDFGAINSMAMEAFREMTERYTFIQKEKQDLAEAKASLMATIKEIDDTARNKFMDAFTQVRENFVRVFRSLFNEEDSCDLILSNPQSPLDSDIDIVARPKGKRPLSINQLSGGEKTLTATALLFSLYLLKPAPFCIFDEVDAPLDDTNIDKFNKIIRKFSAESQFIVVSHNKRTIASTDVVYGVTMVEQGVSKVVAVDLREVA
ncbi:MAG: chromosome segregation protein SMC [Arcticibacter sp.]